MDERVIFVLGTLAAHHITFWFWALFLYTCYANDLFRKHRIQETPFNRDLALDCLKKNIISHIFVHPIALYFAYDLHKWCGMSSLYAPLPSALTVARDLAVAVFLNDTLFYWAHRALHHKSIYKYIHKKHHMFKVNVGISAEYANPIEDVLANIIPTMAGVWVMGSHAAVVWLWLIIRISETMEAHSNYDFPLSPFGKFWWQGGARRHEYHHSHNVGCYGSFTSFWDRLMQTDLDFLKHESDRRERVTHGGVSKTADNKKTM